jgi:hypothetical protein
MYAAVDTVPISAPHQIISTCGVPGSSRVSPRQSASATAPGKPRWRWSSRHRWAGRREVPAGLPMGGGQVARYLFIFAQVALLFTGWHGIALIPAAALASRSPLLRC